MSSQSEVPHYPLVTAVVLNWNGLADTVTCVGCLRQSTYPNLRILLLDNASAGDEADALAEALPDLPLYRSAVNTGAAGGMARLSQLALEQGADYVLVLNNDTEPPPEMIARLVATYRATPGMGLLTARELTAGHPERGNRLGARYLPLFCRVEWQFAPHGEPLPHPLPFDVVSGCMHLVSREVAAKVGLLDGEFFIYWEDVDWCLRACAAGYQNYCATDTYIVHKSGATSTPERGPNLTQLYLVCRGHALLIHRHARGLARLLAPLRALAGIAATMLPAVVRPSRRAEALAKWHGFRDGWLRRPPTLPRGG
jgi:GT2 family glycosyltransferase